MGSSLRLVVTVVADQQNGVTLLSVANGLQMHLGHQRARSVDGAQVARLGNVANLG